MKKNGAARTEEVLAVQVRSLTAEEIADARALATVLGICTSELVARAIRNELKAAESAPTVQAAITAIRSARESIRRRQAVREGKA